MWLYRLSTAGEWELVERRGEERKGEIAYLVTWLAVWSVWCYTYNGVMLDYYTADEGNIHGGVDQSEGGSGPEFAAQGGAKGK